MRKQSRKDSGFSILETTIALAVLAVGVLGLALVFTQGVMIISNVQADLIAKEKAAEAIESVFTARDTQVLLWAQIQNTNNGGVFLVGPQPLRVFGPDGLVNTVDDGAIETTQLPGPDNVLGTPDDITVAYGHYTRQVIIQNLSPTLRQITVIVSYPVGRLQLSYTLTSYISQFA